jgi:hypothetical protein
VTDRKVAESFTEFVRDLEPRLKHALVAAYGTEAGIEATRDALADGWEHWDRVRTEPTRQDISLGWDGTRRDAASGAVWCFLFRRWGTDVGGEPVPDAHAEVPIPGTHRNARYGA